MNAMTVLVETLIEDTRWQAIGLEPLAERAAQAVLVHLGLGSEGFEISLLAADDARVAGLNAQFRGRRGATNVLSWPAEDLAPSTEGAAPAPPTPGDADDPEGLGDIALAFETCAAEAEAAGRALADHATHLVVHGVLHLLGYDHISDADAAVMETLEVEILARLAVANPYEPMGATCPG